MLAINISTPASVMDALRGRYRDLRLSLDLTQSALAKRSGVSLGTIKRFESTGKISLEALLKLSLVLECLDEFDHLARPKVPMVSTIDELLEEKKGHKKRGSIK